MSDLIIAGRMTAYERARYDLRRFLAGHRVSHDDHGSNTPEDARRWQGRNWERWDNYDARDARAGVA
jgi:hypothetical protein